MSIMSIRIDEKKRRALKVIASLEQKTMGKIISELIDEYIHKNKKKYAKVSEQLNLKEIMAVSEESFMEWANKEDEIHNDLIIEAKDIGEHKTPQSAVTQALEEYILRKKQMQIVDLSGHIEYDKDYDYKKQREKH